MLTGLIIAGEEVAGGTSLRAELPVAGQTVLEQQVRMLSEAGAERVIAIAERLPPTLAAALARLRRDGIAVEIVRQVSGYGLTTGCWCWPTAWSPIPWPPNDCLLPRCRQS